MSTENQTLIDLQDISRVYRTDEMETHALKGIDLEIRKGEFLSIEGPSGCGKSTLLSILGLLDAATSGSYTLKGRNVAALSASERARARREHIGFVFQGFNLIGDLSVEENVALPLRYLRVPADERRARVKAALERVQMSHRAKHMPDQLSGGQQQRVAVARAVVAEPTIVLADEPTGNLDSKNGEQVMDLLSELHVQGTTLCMVTHDPRYSGSAGRVVRLFDGQIERAPERVSDVA